MKKTFFDYSLGEEIDIEYGVPVSEISCPHCGGRYDKGKKVNIITEECEKCDKARKKIDNNKGNVENKKDVLIKTSEYIERFLGFEKR